MDSTNNKGPVWDGREGTGTAFVKGAFPEAFDLEGVIPKGDVAREASFYNYQGSLTQPPCTGGVDWWVLSKPITASRDEIRWVHKSIFMSESTRHGNARETQPIGSRKIFVGLTGFQHDVRRPRGYNSGDLPWGKHWGADEVL